MLEVIYNWLCVEPMSLIKVAIFVLIYDLTGHIQRSNRRKK